VDAFQELIESLWRHRVRFVVIGLAGANYYARSAGALFATQDRDLFLAPDADNVLAAWRACESAGLDLICGADPLDLPRDRALAERVVANRASVRATDGAGLDVDLTLEMAGFEFATVWKGRRTFRVEDVEVPVARLRHIVESKRQAARDKDRLFLATHAEMLRDLEARERKTVRQRGKRKRNGRVTKRQRQR
jgi:site-specific recombinase XerC